uniref:Uncharacterized protein n=2 Tax=Anguilla anguilla TaxID=7936 RepID=A0A0E9TJI8_ANGAN
MLLFTSCLALRPYTSIGRLPPQPPVKDHTGMVLIPVADDPGHQPFFVWQEHRGGP